MNKKEKYKFIRHLLIVMQSVLRRLMHIIIHLSDQSDAAQMPGTGPAMVKQFQFQRHSVP